SSPTTTKRTSTCITSIARGGRCKKATPHARAQRRKEKPQGRLFASLLLVCSRCLLGAAQDVHDIAVLYLVRLAFQSVDAMRLGLFHAADAAEVIVAHHFGADEATGEIGMDLAGAGYGVVSAEETPGPALVFANREEDHAAHSGVDR